MSVIKSASHSKSSHDAGLLIHVVLSLWRLP
jgi:hypothetical protein